MTNHERIEVAKRPKRNLLTVAAVAGVFALAACGGGKDHSEGARMDGLAQEAQAASSFPSQRPTAQELPKLTFDDLGGGSSIIQVYPGVKDTAANKRYSHTYKDGQEVAVECKTTGRTVYSHPELNEGERLPTDQWIRLEVPGAAQFATAMYVENPAGLLAKLPEC